MPDRLRIVAANGLVANNGNATAMSNGSYGTLMEFEVPVCVEGSPLCDNIPVGEAVVLVLTLVSVSINIIHVNTLSKMTALKKSSLLTILKTRSLCEVTFSLTAFSRISCCLRMMYRDDRHWVVVFNVFGTTTDIYDDLVLATLLVERNVSMYYSLKEKEAWMLKHIVWILVGEFLLLVTVTVFRDVMYPDSICFLAVRGPANILSEIPRMIHKLWYTLVSMTLLIGLIALMRQMNNVKYKPLNDVQKAALNGGKYTVLMTIGYLAALIPTVLTILITLKFSVGVNLSQAEFWTIIMQLLYGIFCCVLYALVSQAYRTELRNSLKWFKSKLRNLS